MSLAVFTTAPVAQAADLGALGTVIAALEILNGGLVLVLFVALVLRALPEDQGDRLAGLAEFREEKWRRVRETIDSARTQVQKLLSEDTDSTDQGDELNAGPRK